MPSFGISYFVGIDGISLFLVVLTDFLTPIALLSSWGSVTTAGPRVLVLRAGARSGHARRVRLARPVPVLPVLGRDARADVFPHRRLGIRAAHLRGDQVHPLHDGGQRADAHRHHRAGLYALRGDRLVQLQPDRAVQAGRAVQPGLLVLPRVHARVRDQGAAVPVPYLAAGRARRGADRRVGDPRRRAAEDGHVRPRSGSRFRSSRRRRTTSRRTSRGWPSSASFTARSSRWCSRT